MDRSRHHDIQARERGLSRVRRVTGWVAAGAAALAVAFGGVFALGQRSSASVNTHTGDQGPVMVPLGDMVYRKSRKQVHCFAGPAPADAEPRVASWEIDQARFLPLEEARRLIHPDQAVFLDRLVEHLGGG